MAVQTEFFFTDGSTRTFTSTKHIATKQHLAVWRKLLEDDTWEQVNIGDYDLINNGAVFNTAPNENVYSEIEIRVADNPDELGGSPSDISTVARNIEDINTVANDIESVNNVSDNIDVIAECGEHIDACILAMNGPAGEPTNAEYYVSDGTGYIATNEIYNTVQVHVNGSLLTPAVNYIYSNGNITFTPDVPIGSDVVVHGWTSDSQFKSYATFRELEDTPASYSGQGGKVVSIAPDEKSIVFVDQADVELNDYVRKDGDTMSGDLSISKPFGQSTMTVSTSGVADTDWSVLKLSTSGLTDWSVVSTPDSTTYDNEFMIQREVNGVPTDTPLLIDNAGLVHAPNGLSIDEYTPINPSDVVTVQFVDNVLSGGADLTQYVKKVGYQQAGDEMTGPLFILNQTANETGLLVKQFADNKTAVNVISESASEYSSITFSYETATPGVFNGAWAWSAQGENQFVLGRSVNDVHVDNPIFINNSGVVTATGLLSTNGANTMDTGYIPDSPLDVTTKEYVDNINIRKENVLIWAGTPTTGNIPLSALPVNPDTGDKTGQYLVVYSSTATDITSASGASNVSNMFLFNEAQQAAGTSTGYTAGTSAELSFAMITGGNFQAWKYSAAGADVRWYIHRIYRFQQVSGV